MQAITRKTRLSYLLGICMLGILLNVQPSAGQGLNFDGGTYLNELSSYQGFPLDSLWQYHPGDDPTWARVDLDDTDWLTVNTQTLHDNSGKPLPWTGIGWFRKRLNVPDSLRGKSLVLMMGQLGASEIYLDGRLLHRFGKVGKSPAEEEIYVPHKPVVLPLDNQSVHRIAIRYSHHRVNQPSISPIEFRGFWLLLSSPDQALANSKPFSYRVVSLSFNAAFFLFFCFVYGFYPRRLASLLSAVFLLGNSLIFAALYQMSVASKASALLGASALWNVLYASNFGWYILFLYAVYYGTLPRQSWLVVAAMMANGLMAFFQVQLSGMVPFVVFLFLLEVWRMIIWGVWNKKTGFWILFIGYLVGSIGFSAAVLNVFGWFPDYGSPVRVFLCILTDLSFPLTLALHLAWEFGSANRDLRQQLAQVGELSTKNLRQQQEKQMLEQLDTLKSRFFANLSHEFRTPLSLIKGTLEKLQHLDETAAEPQTDYRLMDRQADRLLQMINQLLDLSKLEAGQLQLQPRPGELTSFLRVMGASFASLFESKNITYRYTVPLQPVWVRMDEDKLEQIISNILSNAYKFTPSHGQVRFSATVEPLSTGVISLQLLMEDTGIGIPAEQLIRIFDRFYQVDGSATRTQEGTGIGLALVKELVELHGGRIWAESMVGKGTSFTLHLPLPLATADETEMPELFISHSSHSNGDHVTDPGGKVVPSKKAPQILVVEDHADLRRFLVRNLSKHYTVQEAENGLAGFQLALESLPDLIISDVMMPGMDGFTLGRQLKNDERTSHIPLILLTAKADTVSKQEGLETGADDYVTKPFQLEELQVRVKNLLQQRQKLRERFGRTLTLEPADVAVCSSDELFLQKAIAIMEANMANAAFDVETFSKEIGMSRSHLHRKLTILTGQVPGEFIRTFRLKRAASLLEQQHGNISDVAYQVGFKNLAHFTKSFREYYGKTPSQYARQKLTQSD